ncbi:Antifungal protein ginkbilobin-like protein 1 [Linum perenne]
MTSSSSSFILLLLATLALLITVANAAPNITYVYSSCGSATLKTDEEWTPMRRRALKAIDVAVFSYEGPNEKASCSSQMNKTIVASAMCWGDISPEDCRNCLWNAQFRLVDCYCKYKFGAQLMLTDCYLKYDVQPFCT